MPRLALQLLGCGARFAVASLASLLAVSAPVAISARAPETGARYSDEDPGFAVQAPPGWRLLRQGELELPKGARVGFLGPRGGAYVYVVAESIGGGIIHRNESALAVYLRSLMSPTLYESVRTKPVPAALGGRPALRASMSVTTGQGSLVKTITASREGYWYFAIVSIATPGEAERHMTAHHAFERGVAISKTSDEVVDGIARRIGGFVPFLSAGERRSLLYSLIDRSASPSDGADLVEFVASIAKFGSALIPAADRESLDSLESKARSSPPGQEAERLLRLREYRPGRRAFLREDEARLDASSIKRALVYASCCPTWATTARLLARGRGASRRVDGAGLCRADAGGVGDPSARLSRVHSARSRCIRPPSSFVLHGRVWIHS
jgi:hypothetical protein